MTGDQFSFEQHMEYSLILQTCYYRIDAFYKDLKHAYGDDHEAVLAAAQVKEAMNELKIHMDDLVIQEFPERKLSCVYRTEGRSRKTSAGILPSEEGTEE